MLCLAPLVTRSDQNTSFILILYKPTDECCGLGWRWDRDTSSFYKEHFSHRWETWVSGRDQNSPTFVEDIRCAGIHSPDKSGLSVPWTFNWIMIKGQMLSVCYPGVVSNQGYHHWQWAFVNQSEEELLSSEVLSALSTDCSRGLHLFGKFLLNYLLWWYLSD